LRLKIIGNNWLKNKKNICNKRVFEEKKSFSFVDNHPANIEALMRCKTKIAFLLINAYFCWTFL